MRGRLAGPQPSEDLQHLVGSAAALPQRHAGHLVFMRVPPDAETEFEPTARQVLQAGDLLGDKDRVAQRRDQDAGGEADALGAAGREGECLEW